MPFDFDANSTPFKLHLLLRPRRAKGAAQLTPTQPRDRVLRERLAVPHTHAHQAVWMRTGLDPQPELRARCQHAAAGHPAARRRAEVGLAPAPHPGWAAQHSSSRCR